MKTLTTFVFGAAALLFATFATTTPAAAHGSGFGVTLQIGHNDYYRYSHRRCWNWRYRRHHPYQCYDRYRDGYGWRDRYARDRYDDDYWYWHRRHWPRCYDRRPYHDHDRW